MRGRGPSPGGQSEKGNAQRKAFRQTLQTTSVLRGYHTIKIHDSANGNTEANAHANRSSCPGSHRTYTTGDCLGGTSSRGNGPEITDLTITSSSIRADIAAFKDTADALDQRLTAVEDQMAALPDQETELRSLRAKVTDLEDRNRRDNI
ncbi:hypothetical protein NDU88_003600 [Pleurodeles waltl]|uniref:Uncharacterized protein n=1 Tax=Pleurodeles waltl TaxID=8319 RepID=A0AAV7TNU4_PLEWA|nr:hypothetical protein NDU88_003600 [Pleurodeles waltl]